jgi:hypothetical protein
MLAFFQSKRVWLCIAAIATAIGTAFGGDITWIQAVQAIVAAIMALILGLSVRDATKR